MIKIEVLYPEYMNLYGDYGNLKYLEECLGEVKFIFTALNDEPSFLKTKIDMLYLGPTTENHQLEIIELLLPYKNKIKELINNKVLVLAIGNALEIFTKYIEIGNGKRIKALGIFDFYAKRIKDVRYNELCLGLTKEGLELVGFKNQMSHLYGKNYLYFQKMLLGSGRNPDIKQEGIRYHHFIGTYLLGPILPLNPYFTKSIIEMLGVKKVSLAFEEMALLAYQTRLKEFKEMIK